MNQGHRTRSSTDSLSGCRQSNSARGHTTCVSLQGHEVDSVRIWTARRRLGRNALAESMVEGDEVVCDIAVRVAAAADRVDDLRAEGGFMPASASSRVGVARSHSKRRNATASGPLAVCAVP